MRISLSLSLSIYVYHAFNWECNEEKAMEVEVDVPDLAYSSSKLDTYIWVARG